MTEQSRRRERLSYDGDPTLGAVMRMPKWIGALALALLVAGGFAWLGQWQLSHAVTLNNESAVDDATVRPLNEVTAPGKPVTDESAGYVFGATGAFVAGDFMVVEQRRNGDKEGAIKKSPISHCLICRFNRANFSMMCRPTIKLSPIEITRNNFAVFDNDNSNRNFLIFSCFLRFFECFLHKKFFFFFCKIHLS